MFFSSSFFAFAETSSLPCKPKNAMCCICQYDRSLKGGSAGYAENRCNKWLESDSCSSATFKKTISKDISIDSLFPEKDRSSQCGVVQMNYCGHGRGIIEAENALSGCLKIAVNGVIVNEIACQTFENQAAVNDAISRIQKTLVPGSGRSVIWTAYQAKGLALNCILPDIHSTAQTIVIMPNLIKHIYPLCSQLGTKVNDGNTCWDGLDGGQINDPILCEADKGIVIKKVCCMREGSRWLVPASMLAPIWTDPDPKTGICPSAKILESDSCIGSDHGGGGMFTITDSVIARNSFNQCIKRRKNNCMNQNGAFILQGDKPKSDDNGDLFTISQSYVCIAN